MGRRQYLTQRLVLDAGPLIYLAKLEALDVLSVTAESAHATPKVLEEVTRPQVAYRHPDAIEIEQAVARGVIETLALTGQEHEHASSIAERIPGLHQGETEVISVAIARSMPAVIFERRARRVAAALSVSLIDTTELIIAGTEDQVLREERIVRFARMVNMRLDQVLELLARMGR